MPKLLTAVAVRPALAGAPTAEARRGDLRSTYDPRG